MKLLNDITCFAFGFSAAAFGLINAIRELVQFHRFCLLPLFIVATAIGVYAIKYRIKERKDEEW